MSNQCAALNVFVLLLAPQAAALSGSCSETAPRLRPTVFDIREFGAVGDGKSCNTKVIQLAIDACTSAGGGEVLIAGGSFVTGTIYLKDNVTLHLAAGAALLGSTDIADYAKDTHKNAYANESHMDRCLIFARGAKNIGIVGRGTIDGRGGQEHFPNPGDHHRPMLIRLIECTNLRVRDVTFQNPASWTSAWLYCEDIVVDGIRVHSRANANGDGLDFDGCRNVRVSNCTFDTSDDSICLQASRIDQPCRETVITNCIFVSKWAGIRIGLLSMGDFENIAVSNCIFRDISDAGLKIQMCEGGTMRNLVFSNLVMHRVPRPVFMTFNRWRMGVDTPRETPPMKGMRDMQFSNIRVDNSELKEEACGIVLTAVPGHYIENIALDNIHLTLPGGGTREQASIPELPTFVDRRPEFGVFGNRIPFAGIYARQVRDLCLSNVRIAAVCGEARPAVICNDLHGLSISGLYLSETFSGSETNFGETTVQEMAADSKRRGKPQVIVDSDDDQHRVEIRAGEASAAICPKLGRCKITEWE